MTYILSAITVSTLLLGSIGYAYRQHGNPAIATDPTAQAGITLDLDTNTTDANGSILEGDAIASPGL